MLKIVVIEAGLLIFLTFSGVRVSGQTEGVESLGGNAEEGMPVNDQLVISRCGACHSRDRKGNLSVSIAMKTIPSKTARSNTILLNVAKAVI